MRTPAGEAERKVGDIVIDLLPCRVSVPVRVALMRSFLAPLSFQLVPGIRSPSRRVLMLPSFFVPWLHGGAPPPMMLQVDPRLDLALRCVNFYVLETIIGHRFRSSRTGRFANAYHCAQRPGPACQ